MPKIIPTGSKLSLVVYIPTRGRIGHNRQVTLREFQQYSSCRPVLVCPKDEAAKHRAYYDRVLGCPAKGIGPTRQWILENSSSDIVVMADDDMRFSYRPVPHKPKLERCEALNPLLDHIKSCVAMGYVHGGVGARQGNNRKDLKNDRHGVIWKGPGPLKGHLFMFNERVNNFHFFHREKVLAAGARMDALEVMEDFHFTLTMLTKGHPNVVIHDYVWNQEGSSKEGGCSLYRTPEVQAAGAEGLHAAFPDFVRVVTKTSKDTSTAWKNFKERKDVVVQWLKAFQSSQKKGGK